MAERTKSSKRPSRDERRAQLLDAAVEAIRQHGSGVSMEQLAAQGGVTKPILYRHFGDRDGLARAIGERFAAILQDRLNSAMDEASPENLLWGTIDAYLAFLEEDPELYGFLTSPTAGRGAVEGASAIIDAVARRVASDVGDRLRSQGLDAGGAEPYAYGIVGMVHQAGDWWLQQRTMSRRALTNYLADLLWRGFSNIGESAATAPGDAATA